MLAATPSPPASPSLPSSTTPTDPLLAVQATGAASDKQADEVEAHAELPQAVVHAPSSWYMRRVRRAAATVLRSLGGRRGPSSLDSNDVFHSDSDNLSEDGEAVRPSSSSSNKHVQRLAPGWFWGDAVRAPDAAAHCFAACFLTLVPPYLVFETISRYATWWTVLLILVMLLGRLIVAVSRALVYPGSLSWMRRTQEVVAGTEMKHRSSQLGQQLSKLAKAPEHVRDRAAHAMLDLKRDALTAMEASVREHLERTPHLMETSADHPLVDAPAIKGLNQALSGLMAELSEERLSRPETLAEVLRRVEEHASALARHAETAWTGRPAETSSVPSENRYVRLRDLVREKLFEYRRTLGVYPGISSLEWMQTHLRAKYAGATGATVVSFDGCGLDAVFVPGAPREDERPCTSTIMWCNPNAGLYELASIYSYWLDYFHTRHVNVVYWNYRGFGNSEGRPTPSRLKRDGEAVLTHAHHVFASTSVFAVHGESMGGMVVSHLAQRFPERVQVLTCDRTFAALERVVEAHVGSKLRKFLVRVTTWGTNDSVKNFLSAPTRHKMILQDVQDHIVPFWASLKVGVAHAFLGRARPADPEARPGSDGSELSQWLGNAREVEGFFESLALLQHVAFRPNELVFRLPHRVLWDRPRYAYREVPNVTSEERIAAPVGFLSELVTFVKAVLYLQSGDRFLGKAFDEDVLTRVLAAEAAQEPPHRAVRACRKLCLGLSELAPEDSMIGVRSTRDWFATSACYPMKLSEAAAMQGGERFELGGLAARFGDLGSTSAAVSGFVAGRKDALLACKLYAHAERVERAVSLLARSLSSDPPSSVVALSCGHNGFPDAAALRDVERFYRAAGLYE